MVRTFLLYLFVLAAALLSVTVWTLKPVMWGDPCYLPILQQWYPFHCP